MRYGQHVSIKKTPQTEQVLGKTQVKNDEGGYVFQISPKEQFKRFLVLGSEGGTYYASEKKTTLENTQSAVSFIRTNGPEAVELIVSVSEGGRAPKNDPAIFALALACTFGDPRTKADAYQAIKRVCRIGTHLFQFCQAIQDLRGWSRGLRRGVAEFYTTKDVDKLAYQLVKYRQRDGWTHRDVLRLCHANAGEPFVEADTSEESKARGARGKARKDLLKYAVGKNPSVNNATVQAFEAAQVADTLTLVKLINDFDLSWEMLPTEKLAEIPVWEALLPKMPLTALIRNLARMTANGMLRQKDNKKIACEKLLNVEHLKKSRVHPITRLNAIKTYGAGHGMRGSLTWVPIPDVKDALDEAFEKSFDLVEPTGKSFLLGVDVSGSMEGSDISGTSLTAREAAACLALVTARVEEEYEIMAFSSGFIPLPLTKKSSFNDALKITSGLGFDSTDCALPMLFAMKHHLNVDCFAVYTDSETYTGEIHPFQALKAYRHDSGRPEAKLVVVGMTSNGFSIADPSDPGMLDVVGFDTSTPSVISEFVNSR